MTAIYFGILILVFVLCGAFAIELNTKHAAFNIIFTLSFTIVAICANEEYLKERERLEWHSQFANAIVV